MTQETKNTLVALLYYTGWMVIGAIVVAVGSVVLSGCAMDPADRYQLKAEIFYDLKGALTNPAEQNAVERLGDINQGKADTAAHQSPEVPDVAWSVASLVPYGTTALTIIAGAYGLYTRGKRNDAETALDTELDATAAVLAGIPQDAATKVKQIHKDKQTLAGTYQYGKRRRQNLGI